MEVEEKCLVNEWESKGDTKKIERERDAKYKTGRTSEKRKRERTRLIIYVTSELSQSEWLPGRE